MPVDHEYFDNTNAVQWMWYNYQDIKDQEDHIVDVRDMIEYHASFIEPEIVSKVIESRGNPGVADRDVVAGTTSDSEFNESVRRMFGRDPGITENDESAETHNIDGVLDRITKYQEEQAAIKQTSTPYNYKYWSDVDLEK